MSHTADEVFTPPMVTNRRAEAKVCKDPVTYVWRPDRVERHMRYECLDFSSVTRIAARADAVLIDLMLHNSSPRLTKSLDLFLRLLSGVEKLEDTSVWNTVASPLAATRYDASRRAFLFSGPDGAIAVQGVDQPPLDPRSSIALAEWVSDGDMWGIVSNTVKSPSVYAGFGFSLRLTPGNDRFSGCLPTLRNVEEPIERAYLAGVSNLLFMKRLPVGGILPRVYKSISPRSGPTCWLWDTEQAAPGLALLDPRFLRGISGAWMRSDIHRGCGAARRAGRSVRATVSLWTTVPPGTCWSAYRPTSMASLNAANAWMCRRLVDVLDGRLLSEEREMLGRDAALRTATTLPWSRLPWTSTCPPIPGNE